MDNCKLCNGMPSKFQSFGPAQNDHHVTCPRCGFYTITERAVNAEPDPFVKKRLHLISAVARWSSERDNVLKIISALLEDRSEFEARILSVCPRNTQEKMDAILAYIAEKSSYPGQETRINQEYDYPLFYCKKKEELKFFLDHLVSLNLLIHRELGGAPRDKQTSLTLSGEGWQKVEELAKPNIEGIKKLEGDTGFTMHRVDMEEFNDKICDKIIADIRRSRFLIADVTWHRQAVYFEAGFAKGLGLPVIWTCREDQKDKCDSNFDTRQYNHIFWTEANELREKLGDRIRATVGMAPK